MKPELATLTSLAGVDDTPLRDWSFVLEDELLRFWTYHERTHHLLIVLQIRPHVDAWSVGFIVLAPGSAVASESKVSEPDTFDAVSRLGARVHAALADARVGATWAEVMASIGAVATVSRGGDS